MHWIVRLGATGAVSAVHARRAGNRPVCLARDFSGVRVCVSDLRCVRSAFAKVRMTTTSDRRRRKKTGDGVWHTLCGSRMRGVAELHSIAGLAA
eukprot:5297246-Pleurochrysis_carterae.AAC.1